MRRFYITALVSLLLLTALLPLSRRFVVSAVSEGERQAMYTKPAVVRIYAGPIGNFTYEDTKHNVGAKEIKSFNLVGQGSGFIISPDGYICTNAHVVQDVHDGDDKAKENLKREFVFWVAENFYRIPRKNLTQDAGDYIWTHATMTAFYMIHEVDIADGSDFTFELKPAGYGAVTGENENAKDVAIIKIEVKNAPVVKFGDSDTVQLQDPIRVWGYPAAADINNTNWAEKRSALEASGNPGEVSAKKASGGGAPILQVSAPTGPGNSGGPVLNAKNEVVGLLTFGSKQTQGFHWAVTSNTTMEFVKAVGVKNEFGPADKLYRNALELYWNEHYKEAMPKFEEVKRLFPQHPTAGQLIQSSQQAITDGKDQSGFFSTLTIVGLVVLVLLFFLAILVIAAILFFILRRKSAARPLPAGVPGDGRRQAPAHSTAVKPTPPRPGPYAPPVSRRAAAPAATAVSPDRMSTADLSQTVAIRRDGDTASIGYGLIKFVSGLLAGEKFEVKPEGAYIGRDRYVSQIVIADPRISKRHLWIGVRDNRVLVSDQGSRNGTFLNDPKSPRITEAFLTPGDTVILGEADVARFEYQT